MAEKDGAERSSQTMFHGTDDRVINAFHVPAFFTDKADHAALFRGSSDHDATILQVGVKLSNPLDIRDEEGSERLIKIAKLANVHVSYNDHGEFECDSILDHSEQDGSQPLHLVYIPDVREKLIDLGYDSIIATESIRGKTIFTCVALETKQVTFFSTATKHGAVS